MLMIFKKHIPEVKTFITFHTIINGLIAELGNSKDGKSQPSPDPKHHTN